MTPAPAPTAFTARTNATSAADVQTAIAVSLGIAPASVSVVSLNATTGEVAFTFVGTNASANAAALRAMPEAEREQRAGLSGLSAAAASSATPAPPPPENKGLLATILGSSIGVPLGIAFVALVAFLIVGRVVYKRRKDAAMRKAQEGMSDATPGGEADAGGDSFAARGGFGRARGVSLMAPAVAEADPLDMLGAYAPPAHVEAAAAGAAFAPALPAQEPGLRFSDDSDDDLADLPAPPARRPIAVASPTMPARPPSDSFLDDL